MTLPELAIRRPITTLMILVSLFVVSLFAMPRSARAPAQPALKGPPSSRSSRKTGISRCLAARC